MKKKSLKKQKIFVTRNDALEVSQKFWICKFSRNLTKLLDSAPFYAESSERCTLVICPVYLNFLRKNMFCIIFRTCSKNFAKKYYQKVMQNYYGKCVFLEFLSLVLDHQIFWKVSIIKRDILNHGPKIWICSVHLLPGDILPVQQWRFDNKNCTSKLNLLKVTKKSIKM